MAAIVKKLALQFSINHFSLACIREVLHDSELMERAQSRVRHLIAERERMHRLINHRFGSDVLHGMMETRWNGIGRPAQ